MVPVRDRRQGKSQVQPEVAKTIASLSFFCAGPGKPFKLEALRAHLEKGGWTVSERALRLWRQQYLDDPGSFGELAHNRGRLALLDSDEQMVVAGHILAYERLSIRRTYVDVGQFIDNWWGFQPCLNTIRKLCEQNGVSNKVVLCRDAKDPFTFTQQIDLGKDFIKLLKRFKFYDVPLEWVACVDGAHSSRPHLGQIRTLAGVGGYVALVHHACNCNCSAGKNFLFTVVTCHR